MVLTIFEWPYGGQHVFLTGSFTRWTEHIRMTLMENSGTVFQAIWDLTPGYHQYKFLVDGVWRFNEQEPCVTDEYGAVNNIIFVKELEFAPSILHNEAPKSGMDVDNGIFQHPASLSGGMHQEPVSQILDGDIDAFRRHLSILLSRYTTYELLPMSGKVVALDLILPVKQAFHIMYEQGLSVVPIWDDCNRQFCGMLTASDFILILTELHNNVTMLTNEELEMHSISAWKEGKLQIRRASDVPVQSPIRRPLVQAGPHESLQDVALKIIRNKISVIPIIHSSQDGSSSQLLHLACLSGILKYICRHLRYSRGVLPLLQKPIGRLPLGAWVSEAGRANGCQLTTLQLDSPLSAALNLLIEAQISSIPVVDEKGSLIDVYTRSDITSLANNSVYAHIRLDQTSLREALELVYKATDATYAHKRCQTCLRSDSLHDVMERLSDPAVRRLIVIEAGSKRVEGIISLRDVFNFLLN
ncbi:PREDICTED: sucrose nonfermenting 4-like protein isoform X2 [Nelumbo nucifera]|uniref:Sucrose nonfermenting 4-like protein isoform X2 n=1 Tax=Nelumbo nucifera TaxID=4432 RepID=A0A1U7ZDH1_NELNU|nr:PREDICTED: sucrose nonfermenting 4-like protein isoform X2 [Nelumbo nucifera]